MIGKTIAHYKILEKLGEGGMGVVYKAEDTKLKRTVALKFLSTQALGTEDEKARFVREAQAAASLNHPNICTIYEIQEVDDQLFIAMEYIDGETLHDRIKQGPLKIKEALKLATMAAEGLQAAHEKDIVHRDIKSSNIMLTKKGVAKIMDFGLAKVSAVSVLTQAGSTLGTIAYMSPEQARGEPVDQRSDIFSLGIVLYEMVAGQVPFKGEYEQAMMYSILNVDPEPLTAVRTGVPIALDSIVAKLLAKDPDDRYQHVDELPVDLKAVDVKRGSSTRLEKSAYIPETKVPYLAFRPATVFAVLVALVIGVAAAWLFKPVVIPQVKRLTVNIPPEQQLIAMPITLSQDGRHLVYYARENKRYYLFIRSLDSFDVSRLSGTQMGFYPFFLPDGLWIGFTTMTGLHKISISGGEPQKIIDSAELPSGFWTADKSIIYSNANTNSSDNAIYRFSATGETTVILTASDSINSTNRYFPACLIENRWLIYTIVERQGGADARNRIDAIDLNTGSRKTLLEGYVAPCYVPGSYLVFRTDTNEMMAVLFDTQSMEVKGVPVSLVKNVEEYSISQDGTLAYIPSSEDIPLKRLVTVDRRGNVTPLTSEQRDYSYPRFSPDGRMISVQDRNEGFIHIYDLELQTWNQLTYDGDSDHTVWTSDNQRIVFSNNRALYWRPANGSGEEELLLQTGNSAWPTDVSPDGQLLAFITGGTGLRDIIILSLQGRTAKPFITSPFDERVPMFSPDGRWIAYVSDESGQNEVYVMPYPSDGGKRRISSDGGIEPIWSPDGMELFYRDEDRLMSRPIDLNPTFTIRGQPQQLFTGDFLSSPHNSEYDVHPDGNRFIMVEEVQGASLTHINIVLNFDEELKRKVPTGN
jgi:eukaryotic-like serine/threonine-protein kinase